MRHKLLSWAGLLLVVVLLLGANLLSYTTLRNTRIDLTQNRIYTLSPGTLNILSSLEEPITLRFYYSRKLASTTIPGLSAYVTTVQELLEEYRDAAGGRIRLEVIDPEPFSDEEEEAALAGVQSLPIGATGEPMFLGLVGINSVDDKAIIPFFDPNKESFLEYEISSLVYELSNPRKKRVGILSTLPVMGDSDPMAILRPGEMRHPFAFVTQLRQFYEVEEVPRTTERIPDGLDVLLVIHPKDLSPATQYAIDQHVLRGGRAIVFVDPHSETEEVPYDPQNPYAGLWASKSSRLDALLEAWGVRLREGSIAADRKLAERVTIRDNRGVSEAVPYVAYLTLRPEQFNADDVVTSGLGPVRLGTAGILEPIAGASTTFVPLLSTTEESMAVDVEKVRVAPQPDQLLKEFVAGDKPLVLAARVSGKARSAWPNGLPKPAAEEGSEPEPSPDHLVESKQDIQVIVVADTDILADRFWVEIQNFFGRRMMFENAANGSFVVNAVQNLSGSNDLIAVRSRGTLTRPFDRVGELKRRAEDKYRQRQVELQNRIEEINREINDLQANRSDLGSATSVIFTPEQRQAIERAREEAIRTRRELRNVQYELGRDVNRLGLLVKALNIGAIPLLISLYAVVLGIVRITRRRP
jgi:ABC-type uncharacterized transport system involved in gliding motility auxiliary subunit